jgi:hypothetical protein
VFGASYIPIIVFFTLTGVVLCLLLAELSAMMPGRTGGSPSYAYRPTASGGRGRRPTSTA